MPEIVAEAKKPEKDEKGRFVTGNIGGGRGKGSKNKLTEQFWDDFYACWQENGKQALDSVAKEDPGKFLTVAASVMPKELNVNTTVTDMTDEQLESRIRSLLTAFDGAVGLIAGINGASDGTEAQVRPH